MKNFKFNLEPLLRLKEVEKRKIELELANCQMEIDQHLNQLESENTSIGDMLRESEHSVQKLGSIKSLIAMPHILEIKKRNIKLLQVSHQLLEDKRSDILQRLSIKNSEIKNIKEKKIEKKYEYKKEIDKVDEENLNDLYKSVLHRKKSGVVI